MFKKFGYILYSHINKAKCYLNITDTLRKIQDGNVPVLLMNPESLFSGKWWEVLTTPVYQKFLSAIVIDEAHCVEQW